MAYNNNQSKGHQGNWCGRNQGGYQNGNYNNNRNKPKWYETDDVFVNPYQFVPFASAAPIRKERDQYTGELTGKIHCQLTVKTPLALPDSSGSSTEQNGHKTYPFMSLNNTPYIPGSTLRGMIRSVYEAATNSCMGILESDLLDARSRGFTQNAGLVRLEGKKWFLYPAQIAKLRTFGKDPDYIPHYDCTTKTVNIRDAENENVTYSQGQKVRFNLNGAFAILSETGSKTGYLLIGEKGLGNEEKTHRTYSHIIYDPKTGNQYKKEIENAGAIIKRILALYQDSTVNKALNDEAGSKHHGYKGYAISTTDYMPVFYKEIINDSKTEYVLSLAMQGREAYNENLVHLAGAFKPCSEYENDANSKDCVCPACALFGLIRKKEESYAGRVRFSDASFIPGTIKWERGVTLKELSSPKITTTEFYTQRPDNAREWNYEYKINRRGQEEALKTDEPQIRGRKFYLHQNNPHQYRDSIKTKRNVSVDLLQQGDFEFDVYYDHLGQEELNMLLWCLSPFRLLEGVEEQLYHKLGFGRPLGLGSVAIKIQQAVARNCVLKDGKRIYTVVAECEKDKREGLLETERMIPSALKNVLAFGFSKVSYPLGTDATKKANEQAGYQWFMGNRQLGGSSTGVKNDIKYVLPYLPTTVMPIDQLEKNMYLPSLKKQYDGTSGTAAQNVATDSQRPFSNMIKIQISAEKNIKIVTEEEQDIIEVSPRAAYSQENNDVTTKPSVEEFSPKAITIGKCSSCRKNNVPLYPYMFGKMICDECRKKLSIK